MSSPLTPLSFTLGDRDWTGKLLQHTDREGIRHLYLDIPELYDRDGIYCDEHGDPFPDNALRFAVLSKAVLAAIEQYKYAADIIHCHDWHSALISLYKSHQEHSLLGNTRVVMTIHNLAFQGVTPPELSDQLGLSLIEGAEHFRQDDGQLNLLKGGILTADVVTTVSPTYAQEIATDTYGCGLQSLFGDNGVHVEGIINGVDYRRWSPEEDNAIDFNYNEENQNGKRMCKIEIQKYLGLTLDTRKPLIISISRLTHQKGIDLLLDGLKPLIQEQKCQLVILGEGDPEIEKNCSDLSQEFPQEVAFVSGYNDPMAHRLMAAADILAMPSRYEPCGLSQLYAMRYGTIPIVRSTGGLKDTVIDVEISPDSGTGFCFDDFSKEAFQNKVNMAISYYTQARKWRQMTALAMNSDFSWSRSAEKYMQVYKAVLEKNSEH